MAVEPTLGISEIMPRLGVSRQTVIREIKAKRLPAMRIRYEYRIKLSDLEKYERACARRAA